MKLRFKTEVNLLSWVEIAVSGNAKDWRVVRERAPIYVLRAESMGENTDVTHPDSVSRFLRIRVLDGSDRYTLTSAEVGVATATVAERVPAAVALVASANGSGASVWTSEGHAESVPLSRVTFEAPDTPFSRSVAIEHREDDYGRWSFVGRGDILRAPEVRIFSARCLGASLSGQRISLRQLSVCLLA